MLTLKCCNTVIMTLYSKLHVLKKLKGYLHENLIDFKECMLTSKYAIVEALRLEVNATFSELSVRV